MRPTITLLTDFGTKDAFVGQMKGVIYGIRSDVNIVDLTHEITPFSVREAAVILGMSFEHFPPGTVHVCVVDPGVGSGRRPLIVARESHYFVGPDNGIFSAIYRSSQFVEVVHMTSDHYFMKKDGVTFHGRDIFAPAAAWLVKGTPLTNFGEKIDDFVRIELPAAQWSGEGVLEGEVLYLDRFGNAITNIRRKDLPEDDKLASMTITCGGRRVALKGYYADSHDAGLCALINSNGLLELFSYRGNAAAQFTLTIGDRISVVP